MKQGFEKFLSKEQLGNKVKGWQLATQAKEGENLSDEYKLARLDSGKNSISELHGVSFIKDIIPELIANKKKGEKVRILDIGAGAAFFTDEIRKKFPDDVRVFSTGIRKKTARDYRRENKPEGESKLHPDDLKWRSILELSDFEEFDLIIDTAGEFAYSVQAELDVPGVKGTPEAHKRALEYLTAVIKKLKPGGLASIFSRYMIIYATSEGKTALHRLEKEYAIKITTSVAHPYVLRIEKDKSD